MKRLSTQYVRNFIENKFPNIKLRDDFEYKDAKTKIVIICNSHGEQEISFHKLKSRSLLGCPKCGLEAGYKNMLKTWHYTEEEIKDKIYRKYGRENVDLSKFVFKNVRDKSIVVCKKHNKEFHVTPYDLCKDSRGYLCPKCRYGAVRDALQRNLKRDDFITLSKSIFNDMFLYNNLPEIINIKQRLILTCKIHGDISIRVETHLKGNGCKKCGAERARLKVLGDGKAVMDECRVAFDNFYNYDKAVYNGVDVPIIITCPLHGDFKRTPYYHLKKKHKCPKCSKYVSFIENDWLNKMNIPNDENHRQVKIRVGKRRTYRVDGIIEETKTIYEFMGDYYHGNPEIFKPETFNKKCHKTHGELYQKTINKLNTLYQMGYKVIYIWESDFRKGKSYKVWDPQETETILQFDNALKSFPPA